MILNINAMIDTNYKHNQKETSSLEESLGPIIVGGLKQFVSLIKSQKGEMDCGFIVPCDFTLTDDEKNSNGGQFSNGELELRRWVKAVEAMIYAFEDNEPVLPDGVVEMTYGEESKVVVTVLNQNLYNKHKAEYSIHYTKVSEGLELFAKHYRELWW